MKVILCPSMSLCLSHQYSTNPSFKHQLSPTQPPPTPPPTQMPSTPLWLCQCKLSTPFNTADCCWPLVMILTSQRIYHPSPPFPLNPNFSALHPSSRPLCDEDRCRWLDGWMDNNGEMIITLRFCQLWPLQAEWPERAGHYKPLSLCVSVTTLQREEYLHYLGHQIETWGSGSLCCKCVYASGRGADTGTSNIISWHLSILKCESLGFILKS